MTLLDRMESFRLSPTTSPPEMSAAQSTTWLVEFLEAEEQARGRPVARHAEDCSALPAHLVFSV